MSGKKFGANRVSLGVQRRLDVPDKKDFVDQTVKLADIFLQKLREFSFISRQRPPVGTFLILSSEIVLLM